jgi:hypothetical protein
MGNLVESRGIRRSEIPPEKWTPNYDNPPPTRQALDYCTRRACRVSDDLQPNTNTDFFTFLEVNGFAAHAVPAHEGVREIAPGCKRLTVQAGLFVTERSLDQYKVRRVDGQDLPGRHDADDHCRSAGGQLLSDEDCERSADSETHHSDSGPVEINFPHSHVRPSPSRVESPPTGRCEVAVDVAVGVEQAHLGNVDLVEILLLAGRSQKVLWQEDR